MATTSYHDANDDFAVFYSQFVRHLVICYLPRR